MTRGSQNEGRLSKRHDHTLCPVSCIEKQFHECKKKTFPLTSVSWDVIILLARQCMNVKASALKPNIDEDWKDVKKPSTTFVSVNNVTTNNLWLLVDYTYISIFFSKQEGLIESLQSSSPHFVRNWLVCFKPAVLIHSNPVRTHTPQQIPFCPNLRESLCMAFSLFLQPIEVKITVGCERAEWLYISKITGGIYHCQRDTPTGMNWVKWEQCIGQGALTVTNAPSSATNRSVQIAGGL